MSYDRNNIFARILRGELPCKKIYEDEAVLAFHDVHPQAPSHILVVPKREYVSFDDFTETASDAEIAGFMRAIGRIAREQGLAESGYRLVANHGPDSQQGVPHLHFHILGGRKLGELLVRQ